MIDLLTASLSIVLRTAVGMQSASAPSAPPSSEPIEPWMERITAGGRDFGGLSESLLQPQLELGVPLGFRGIYQIRGRNDLFVRQSGGLYGVFPRSEYVATKKQGVVAVWPAGTEFFIGTPDETSARREGVQFGTPMVRRAGQIDGRGGAGRIDLRRRSMVAPVRVDTRPAPVRESVVSRPLPETAQPRALPRYMQDDAYRRQTLDALDSTRESSLASAQPDGAPDGR